MSDIKIKTSKLLGESYSVILHDSGLAIYVFPKKMTTSFAIFGTKYGSIDNKFRLAGESEFIEVPNGIAHFLEHKLFENEDGMDAFAKYARTGANANAFTSFCKTAYLFSCTENFSDSLEILLDFVTKPYFTKQTVAKEQGIIGQEIRMGEDNPGRRLFYSLLEAMYASHPVRINIAGTLDTIAKITPELLYSCYNTFYNLNNMALCICGDIKIENVLTVADKVLKRAPERTIERCYAKEKAEVYKKEIITRMQVAKPLFDIGIKDVDIPSGFHARMRKAAGMAVLDEILFSKSSDFFSDLYKKGLLSNDYSFGYEINESFAFNEISGESKDPDAVYCKLKEHIDKAQKNGICQEDFERAKKVVYSDYIKGFDSTEEIACELLGFVFEGGDMFEYADIIRDLTLSYVDMLLRTMFCYDYFAVSKVYPIEK